MSAATAPHAAPSEAARTHYREFYEGVEGDGRPLLVVVGNCQAESIRLLLAGSTDHPTDVRTVRLPPVHELTPYDVGPLDRLLARTDVLVAQPVVDDYRGLPVGTRQLAGRLRPGARHVLVPSVRWSGLHPFHLLVHPPGLERPDPPMVPYHDVRTAVAAAWQRAGRPVPETPETTVAMVREIAAGSLAELRRREREHDTVVVSDLLEHPAGVVMRSINHPGNAVLEPLAARVRDRLDLTPYVSTIGRPLLDGLHAPVEPVVIAAHGLPVEPWSRWRIEGRELAVDEVSQAHLAWYAERPGMLDAALERSVDLRRVLGLRLPGEASC